jgi:hypothetical protein
LFLLPHYYLMLLQFFSTCHLVMILHCFFVILPFPNIQISLSPHNVSPCLLESC